MNNDMGGILDPHAGRYGGQDPAAKQAFLELQQNFQQMRPDPVLVIAGRAPQPGHYYILELQGQATSDGVASIPPDYGLQRTDNVIIGINTFEQGLNTWWCNTGTTVVGSRRINQGTAQTGTDSLFFGVPFNFAGSNRADGGTGGATNTGGFGVGDPNGDGHNDGSGNPPGDPGGPGGTGGLGGGVGGSGPGGGFGPGDGGGTGGGDDGSCPLIKTLTIGGADAGNSAGAYPCTWDGAEWHLDTVSPIDGSDQSITINGGPGAWAAHYFASNPGGTFTLDFTSSSAATCPPDGEWTYTGGGDITGTIS